MPANDRSGAVARGCICSGGARIQEPDWLVDAIHSHDLPFLWRLLCFENVDGVEECGVVDANRADASTVGIPCE